MKTAPRIRIEDLPPLETLTEEEMSSIFGAGRVHLGIELLERRDMMAANLIASFTRGFFASKELPRQMSLLFGRSAVFSSCRASPTL